LHLQRPEKTHTTIFLGDLLLVNNVPSIVSPYGDSHDEIDGGYYLQVLLKLQAGNLFTTD
jgi:hypothetical protein